MQALLPFPASPPDCPEELARKLRPPQSNISYKYKVCIICLFFAFYLVISLQKSSWKTFILKVRLYNYVKHDCLQVMMGINSRTITIFVMKVIFCCHGNVYFKIIINNKLYYCSQRALPQQFTNKKIYILIYV